MNAYRKIWANSWHRCPCVCITTLIIKESETDRANHHHTVERYKYDEQTSEPPIDESRERGKRERVVCYIYTVTHIPNTRIHTHIYMHIYTHTEINTYTCTYEQYTHIYTHTHSMCCIVVIPTRLKFPLNLARWMKTDDD